jgi:hypothetical protein
MVTTHLVVLHHVSLHATKLASHQSPSGCLFPPNVTLTTRSPSYAPHDIQSIVVATRRRQECCQGSHRQRNIRPSALRQMQQATNHPLVLQLVSHGFPWVYPPQSQNASGAIGTTLNLADTPNFAASTNALFSWSMVMVPSLHSRHMWMLRKSSDFLYFRISKMDPTRSARASASAADFAATKPLSTQNMTRTAPSPRHKIHKAGSASDCSNPLTLSSPSR